MSSSRTFVRGALILTVAAMVSKLLGSVYTIVLQNLIGDRGMGLYQMAYPVYATLLVISTAGFPVAISKYVSEYTAIHDLHNAHRIFRAALLLLTALGLVAMIAMYVLSGSFAVLAGDSRAALSLQAVAPALLIVPILSSVRGYFQGWQWMRPTAVSQVTEQLVRVVTIMAGVWLVLSLGGRERAAAAIASFGAVTGGIAGLAVILYQLRRFRSRLRHEGAVHGRLAKRYKPLPWRVILRKLIYYSIPVSLGALIIPLFSNVDAFTVTNLLKAQGVSQNTATHLYGLLSGRAFKLLMLPATLVSSIGIALLPAVSDAYARSGEKTVAERIRLGMRYTLLLAMPAAVGLTMLARPIDVALFRDGQGVEAIMWMGAAVLFSSIQINSAASLQGLGSVYTPLVSLIVGTVLKVALNLLLVPRFQIAGAAAATAMSYAFAGGWNWFALKRVVRLRVSLFRHGMRSALAVLVMGAFVFAAERQWERLQIAVPVRLNAAGEVAVGVLVGVFAYALMLLISGLLTEREVVTLPKIGVPLVRVLRKIHFYS